MDHYFAVAHLDFVAAIGQFKAPERFATKSDEPGNDEHPDHDEHKAADKHGQQGAFVPGIQLALLIEAAQVKNTPVLVLDAVALSERHRISRSTSRRLPAQTMQQRVEFSPLGKVRGPQCGTSLSSLPAGRVSMSGLRQCFETRDQDIRQDRHRMTAAEGCDTRFRLYPVRAHVTTHRGRKCPGAPWRPRSSSVATRPARRLG